MDNNSEESQFYGHRYILERLEDRPFFLGTNGLSGERGENGQWTFHTDPTFCFPYICANFRLEDILIYFFHVKVYSFKECLLIPLNIVRLQNIISAIFHKIDSVINSEHSIEFDTMMAVYNLLISFNEVMYLSYSVFYDPMCMDLIKQNYQDTHELELKLRRISLLNFEIAHSSVDIAISGCEILQHTMLDLIRIYEHADLKNESTKIITVSQFEYCMDTYPSYCISDDPFYHCTISRVYFAENDVNIVNTRYLCNIDYTRIRLSEISGKAITDWKICKSCEENSINDAQALDNYRELQTLCINSFNSSTQNIEEFSRITKYFIKNYWKQRSKRSEQNMCILFKQEETRHIFHFTTLMIKYLEIILKDDHEFEELVIENLREFGRILNSVRFSEIKEAISLETSVILCRTLDLLYRDLSVLQIRVPATIFLVTGKIAYFLGMIYCGGPILYIKTGTEFPTISFQNFKLIEDANQISRIRRYKWNKILGCGTTVDNYDQFYNRDMCPVCRCDQQKDDSCLLICKHTICSSCMEYLISDNNMNTCPVCRHPVNEYILSEKVSDICKALQLIMDEENPLHPTISPEGSITHSEWLSWFGIITSCTLVYFARKFILS